MLESCGCGLVELSFVLLPVIIYGSSCLSRFFNFNVLEFQRFSTGGSLCCDDL